MFTFACMFLNFLGDCTYIIPTEICITQLCQLYRDVSGVELLMNNHQSLKAEVDAREENFTICLNLGRDLLDRKHYRSDEVKHCFMLHSEQPNI